MYDYIYCIIVPLRNICQLVLFLCFVPQTWGQDKSPVFKNFSKELISSETYDLAEDKRGKIWIASDRGLIMYDGIKFHRVPTHQQIQTNAIFGIKAESENCIWIITKRNELFSFDPLSAKPTLRPFKFNENLRRHIQNYASEQFINNITWQNDSLFVSLMQPDRIIVTPEGLVVNSNPKVGDFNSICTDKLILNDDATHPFSSYMSAKYKNERAQITVKKTNSEFKQLVSDLSFTVSNKMKSVAMFGEKNGSKYFAIGRYFIQKSAGDQYKVLTLNAEILDFEFNGSNAVVGTFKGVYEVDTMLIITDHYLEEQAISSVLKDKNGGFWFTTLARGVFYTPSLDLKVYNGTQELLLKSLTVYNDVILCNENNLMIHVIHNRQLIRLEYLVQLGNVFRHEKEQNEFYFGSSYYDDYSRTFNYLPGIEKGSDNSKKTITGYGKFIRIHENSLVKTYKLDSSPYILTCYQINDSVALLGTSEGVMKYFEGKRPIPYTVKNFNLTTDVRDIINIDGQLVYLVNDGIIVENDNKSYKINSKNGLQNDYLSGICANSENSFWAYGNQGVNLIELGKNSFNTLRFKEFNYLPSKEISALTVHNNEIYVGTKEGICHINTSNLTKGSILNKANFSIDSILSSGTSIALADTITIEPDNHGVSFFFNYIDFSNNEIAIEYKLQNEPKWIETNNNSVHLASLPFGSQSISFRANFENENLLLGSYIIFVPTPIFEQWWFIPAFMLLGIIPLFILFRWMLIRRQKKEQEKTKLEMSLLSSRMNPHFTFNTISSIQSYILKNEKAPAIQYLSDFGLLMRKSLDYSYKDYINISDELEFLKLLVTLENKRFDSDFHLKISRKDRGREFKIPALLIQPIVENVILHCVFPTGAEKAIYIEIDETDQNHIIIIEDFGMNLESKNKKNHESHGLSIVRDRLKLHNGKHFSENDFTLLNKTEPGQHGYKVTLKLLRK